tara:strand:- start:2713 stop:2904 length:192 start_codon:yes stop_codon:yes gene_type:complete
MDKHINILEEIGKKPNKDLISIFKEIQDQHQTLKKEVEEKIDKMEKLEVLFEKVDEELKKRNI